MSALPPTHMLYGAQRPGDEAAPTREGFATRVALSSGDVFWVDALPAEVAKRGPAEFADLTAAFVSFGSRLVNPAQIAQLSYEAHPTILTPERLEASDGTSVS